MPSIKPDAPVDPALALPTPPMVAVGSPEFNAAVEAAVARAMAAVPPAAPAAAPNFVMPQPLPIQHTSIDTTQPGPDDLTVQFNRFCTFQNCGYQRGSQAGFPRETAEKLARHGSAFIVHDPRAPARRAA